MVASMAAPRHRSARVVGAITCDRDSPAISETVTKRYPRSCSVPMARSNAPALRRATALGLRTPLSVAVLFDTIVQHGAGDDPDGLPALIERTRRAAGGTPADGIDEKTWITQFLHLRRATLLSATDPSTRPGWARSAGRCDVLMSIVEAGNSGLDGPIRVKSPEYDEVIP